ncbi:MAG: MBL fold metallo-hydrolase [Proteobacteria bacterium]|nr:MBL fold metallo-hydrolase [Pseudomonadota bacterium]
MNPMLVEIKLDRPDFDRFIGAWVIEGEKNVVVDVGPSNPIEGLFSSLSAMGVRRVDLVLLTHIHIDHAGGLAEFLDHFPMAKAVTHKDAIPHLVDPAALWSGSRRVLGDLCDTYGPIASVASHRLIPHIEADVEGLQIIETPGHASHHLCFVYGGVLFAGEAAGVYLESSGAVYLRPATPPPFRLHESLKSVDRLLALPDLPLCYGHFGGAESSLLMLQRAREQLLRWEGMIKEVVASGQDDLIEKSMERLLAEDQELAAFEGMTPQQQERDRFFMAQCVEGFLGYLTSL